MNIITHNKQSQLSKKIKSVAKIWKLKIDFNTLLNLVMWINYYISMSDPIYYFVILVHYYIYLKL